ncbi:MAG: tetratricopeptide repeat protein, partial [Bacteroidales bacterium]
KLRAVVIGPKAKEKIDGAVEKDPEAVRTLLEKANQLNFSPKLVGGDTGKAIGFYIKALERMEAVQPRQKEDWIYVNTLVVLAATYEKTGNYTDACAVYEKIMDYDPGIRWVKEDLYPGCREKAVADRYPLP